VLAPRQGDPSRWVTHARRLLGFAEIDDVLSRVETVEGSNMSAAVAKALDIRFAFNGLENLATVGDRPVIVFGNHPLGSGNVLGMSVLLTERFSDHRIIGHRYMKCARVFAEKMIPVDPFHSTAPINLESLVKLRREFGTQYQALGLFPAGNSSQLKLSGTISDRPWLDAFIRIARHHDALLVPLWFSGRNRLRYYVASKIRAELGFLALPAEFLRLRGKSITVNIGKPISPDALRAMPNRPAQLSFLRAGVYELERERAMLAEASDPLPPFEKGRFGEGTAGGKPWSHKANGVRIAQSLAVETVPVGEHLELRFFDAAAAARIEELAGSAGRVNLDGATTHVVLTSRSLAHALSKAVSMTWTCSGSKARPREYRGIGVLLWQAGAYTPKVTPPRTFANLARIPVRNRLSLSSQIPSIACFAVPPNVSQRAQPRPHRKLR
jgi:putative hemolysin